MANNIVVGANARMAIVDADFADMGLTPEQILIIYKAEANYKSWKPGRSLNAITGIQNGQGYLIIALQAVDLTAYFGNDPVQIVSGIPEGGQPDQILAKAGSSDFIVEWQTPTGLRGLQGEQGLQGEPGTPGAPGDDGVGVPTGGATGQILSKASDDDFDTEWIDAPLGNNGAALADGVVSGLGLSATGLNVQVGSGTWRVNGTNYTTTDQTDLTLEAADETDNRFDIIIGDISGEIAYVKGDATANPVKPEVPTNAIEIGFVLVTPTGTSVNSAPPADYVTSAELLTVTGDRENLNTNNKNTLVEAVNEVASDVQQINQDNVILKIFKKTNYS